MSNFNFNKATIGGRLTGDVELKTTPSGVSVCSFSVAVARKAKRDETDFINCVAWRGTAEFISKYFRKGSSICVTGAIQTRSWTDNNGNKRFATELVVDDAYFVDSKAENTAGNAAGVNVSYEEFGEFGEVVTDDDLPF